MLPALTRTTFQYKFFFLEMALTDPAVLLAPANGTSEHIVLPLKLITVSATNAAADAA